MEAVRPQPRSRKRRKSQTVIYVRPQLKEETYKKLVHLKQLLEANTWDELVDMLVKIVEEYVPLKEQYDELREKYEKLREENKKLWKLAKRCIALSLAVRAGEGQSGPTH